MCPRISDDDDTGSSSSGICRIPVKMPILNMNQVMEKAVPELRIITTSPSSSSSLSSNNAPTTSRRSFHRKLAILKLRLSMNIRRLGITSVLHVRHDCPATETFLAAFFQAAAALVGLKLILIAAALLLGIPETDRFNDVYRQLPDLQLVDDGLITTSLETLLSRRDPNIEVYNEGRIKFKSMLSQDDYLSSTTTPLETAYIWTPATQSAIVRALVFYEYVFTIKCKTLEPVHLFPDVLYYADTRNGKSTHPLADIFFITKEQQLVLVAVKKKKNLLTWIGANDGCINGYTLHGVVLAPNDDDDDATDKDSSSSSSSPSPSTTRVPNSNDSSAAVEVVRGMDARRLLGGLNQSWNLPLKGSIFCPG
eukprot:gene28071-36960_t